MENWLDTVDIRLMKEADLKLIEWDGEYARYRRIYREVFRNYLIGRCTPWIAETEVDGVIGQVFLTEKLPHLDYSPNRPYMFLSSFRVKPGFRNMGLGTLLLKICEITTRDKKIPAIYLNCARNNPRSKTFYLRNGFTVFRSDPGEWSFIDDQGLMRQEIEPAWTMVKKIQG